MITASLFVRTYCDPGRSQLSNSPLNMIGHWEQLISTELLLQLLLVVVWLVKTRYFTTIGAGYPIRLR